MALSQSAATNLTAGSDSYRRNARKEEQEQEQVEDFDDAFPVSPTASITLEEIPHLREYVQDLHPVGPNPLDRNPFFHPTDGFYLTPSDVILRQVVYDLSRTFPNSSLSPSPSHGKYTAYHRAGPRNHIFFDPCTTRAAIVTCGGLCPGMNTVIRELVVGLWDLYGVRQIYGIKAGYRGFYSAEPVQLNPKLVHNWHKRGGTALETSRGGFDLTWIVDAIEHRGFDQVHFNFWMAGIE